MSIATTTVLTPAQQQWVEELRTTTRQQAQNQLGYEQAGVVKFCCLMVAIDLLGEPWQLDLNEVRCESGATLCMPGTVAEQMDTTRNARLDWPHEVWDVRNTATERISGDWLNDEAELSFAQIADIVEYMGLRPHSHEDREEDI